MPDMFTPKLSTKVLQPLLNFKDGYQKNFKEFLKLGIQLGCSPWQTWRAFKKAVKAQEEFEEKLKEFGKEAIEFGKKNRLPVIVVLGHPYIINSPLLNAGAPEIIAEKGAIALPAECYPLERKMLKLDNIYWGYGHRLLDVAYEVRRKSGVFPLWLSVYSCGPDSFLTHFFQYLSQGKPYCLLESDAYTGQAGFKTRIEAFLYSVKNYQEKEEKNLPDLQRFEIRGEILSQIENRKVLIPWMGEGSILAPVLLKSFFGIEAEYLPMADKEALEIGRQYTSGKECLPMIVTIGALLKYLKEHPEGKYAYFMPQAGGPCRFGQYQLLTKIILENLGLSEKVIVISPTSETGYKLGEKFSSAMRAKAWATFVLLDLLRDAMMEKRASEKNIGESEKIFHHYLELAKKAVLETKNSWSEFPNLWLMKNLAEKAVKDFQKIPIVSDKKPRILVTGEIYVRLDEFSNGQIIRELENLGARVKLAPFREWVNYTTYQRRKGLTTIKQNKAKIYLNWLIQKRIESKLYHIFARGLGWKEDHSIDQILKTAKPYLSHLRPLGESALTIGLPLLLWKKKEIDGVVIVGPFECMPTRVAESQLNLISEKFGLPVLSLSFYGEPIDTELLESFVWNLRKNFYKS
jgi:predicted nucleotide-binding protein (sugar kinase/HSP70/actin superfamily)